MIIQELVKHDILAALDKDGHPHTYYHYRTELSHSLMSARTTGDPAQSLVESALFSEFAEPTLHIVRPQPERR